MAAIQVPTDPRLFRLAEGDETRPRLLGSHAPESDLYFWPRRLRCPVTRTPVTDVDLSPEGVLYAWTFLYVPRMGSISFGDTGGYGVGQISRKGFESRRRCSVLPTTGRSDHRWV